MQKNIRLRWLLAIGVFEIGVLAVFLWASLSHEQTSLIASILVALSAASAVKIATATVLSDSDRIHVASGVATILSGAWILGTFFYVRNINGNVPIHYGLAVTAFVLLIVGIELIRGNMWTYSSEE